VCVVQAYLSSPVMNKEHGPARHNLDIKGRMAFARAQLEHVSSPDYLKELKGTIGADPTLLCDDNELLLHSPSARLMAPATRFGFSNTK